MINHPCSGSYSGLIPGLQGTAVGTALKSHQVQMMLSPSSFSLNIPIHIILNLFTPHT